MARVAADGAAFASSRSRGRSQAGAAADGHDGTDADLPAAADHGSAPRAPDLSVSAAQSRGRSTESGLVRGYHLHPDASRVSLSGRSDGLVDAPGAELASVDTMDVEFCIAALEEALARFGRPEIFNSDQGSQFTSPRFTEVLTGAGVRISMDGRGRWMDNVFIERLWRSLKYECVYLHAFETGSELRVGLTRWIGYYNGHRPHSALGGLTPEEAYAGTGLEARQTARLAA